jgi:YegS/Rv2252/BmrU family lipid kinase
VTAPLPEDSTPGRAALLINARARSGDRAEAEVVAALTGQGLTLDRVVRVRRPRLLAQVVDSLLHQGLQRLIVGGGDGTLSTVAARLAGRPTLLGVIPLGTANDFARTLGIPANLWQAAAVAAGTHARAIDLARANDAYFLNVASIGMSVALTNELSGRLKRSLGRLSYAVAGARAFVRHPTFRARITRPGAADAMDEAVVHQVVACRCSWPGVAELIAHFARSGRHWALLLTAAVALALAAASGRWPPPGWAGASRASSARGRS